MTVGVRPTSGRIRADRWPSEMPLFIAVLVTSILFWLLLIVSVIGLVYALFLGLFFFVSHLAFVSHLRGSGVRLGPDQFPELHQRIQHLAGAMEMEPPDAYVLQAGGTLNALATRFLGRNIVVLYSDLLEACGDNEAARDMIITHELAHLRCGHLRWTWLILPGYFVPFLGSALSRAREYTCDRFGLAGAGDAAGATLGLAILSAGPRFGREINLRAFVNQRADTNTGFMTLGEWFSTHPPLSKRIALLNPALSDGRFHPGRGRALAMGIVALFLLGGVGLTVVAARVGSRFMSALPGLDGAATSAALTPEDLASDSYTSRAFEATRAGDLETARQLAERATEVDDTDADAHDLISQICFYEQDFACALERGRLAVGLRPSEGMFRESLGMALLGNGLEEEALAELAAAVGLDATLGRAWLNRARLAHMLERFAEADSAYTALQELDPEFMQRSGEDLEMWASARERLR